MLATFALLAFTPTPFVKVGLAATHRVQLAMNLQFAGGLLSEDGTHLFHLVRGPGAGVPRAAILDLRTGADQPIDYLPAMALGASEADREAARMHIQAKDRPVIVCGINRDQWVVDLTPRSSNAYRRRDRSYGNDVVRDGHRYAFVDLRAKPPRITVVSLQSRSHMFLDSPGPTRWESRTSTLFRIEASRAINGFDIWDTRVDFRAGRCRTWRLQRLSARSSGHDLSLSSIGPGGNSAVVRTEDAGRPSETLLWRPPRVTSITPKFAIVPPTPPMILGSHVVAQGKANPNGGPILTEVFESGAWRVIASNWKWVAWNASQTKLLAVDEATGNALVFTLKDRSPS